MEQRALALDPQQLAAARDALEHEPLGRAGEEVGDDGVDRDAPAGDRDPGLAGRDELAGDAAPPRLAASSSSATVIFPIAQSEPTVSTIRRSRASGSRPVGTLRSGGGLRRSRSSTPCRARELGQLRRRRR